METHGIKRLLFGINISISAMLLAMTSSGMSGVVLAIGAVGFLMCVAGMATESRS